MAKTNDRKTMKAWEEYQRFGDLLKDIRKEGRITLRDFCQAAGADPGNISKMERGLTAPPKSQTVIERYAKALGVEEGSEPWNLFLDLAATGHGQIPPDLMEDEQLVKMLPVFFRTLRGTKPTEEELRALADKIRKG